MDAKALREAGNAAFASKQYAEAAAQYTLALALDDTAALRSNRSAARAGLEQFAEALADADAAVALQPTWHKAHYRRGVALHELGRYTEAADAFGAAAAAVQQPADEVAMYDLQSTSLRRVCLSADGATLTAHFSFDDAALMVACASAQKTLRVVDATAALHLSPGGVAAALKGCPLVETVLVAFQKEVSAQQRKRLREALPASARLEIPTETLMGLPRPPAVPFGDQPPPMAARGPFVATAVELMSAYPESLFVQWHGAYDISWLSLGNAAGVTRGGACAAIAKALRLHGPRGRAYGAVGEFTLGTMLHSAQSCVADSPAATAQFLAAGGMEGVAAALRRCPADHFGVVTHGWNLLDSLAGASSGTAETSITQANRSALAQMADAGLFAMAVETLLSESRAPTRPRMTTFMLEDNCACACITQRLAYCKCVVYRVLCVVYRAVTYGDPAVRAALPKAGLINAITVLLAPATWDKLSRAQVQPVAMVALEALAGA